MSTAVMMLRWRRRTSSFSTASPKPGAAGIRSSQRSPNATARSAPDIRGHGRASAVVPVTLDAVIEDVAGSVAGKLHAGRLLDGRQDRVARRAGARVARRAPGADRRKPGIAEPAARAAPRARRRAARRTSSSARRSSSSRAGGRLRRCLRGNRWRSRRQRTRPAAQHARGAGARAARPRHRRAGAALGAAAESSGCRSRWLAGEREISSARSRRRWRPGLQTRR